MNAMTLFCEHIRAGKAAPLRIDDDLVLRFEQRQKARQRARLESGRFIGIQLERGTILRGGDYLKSEDGELIRIIAAREAVSIATSDDPLLLARAAYHLGNRHVPLQVGSGFVQYLVDHVLDSMLESLGLRVTHAHAPFEPEAGAYSHSPESTHGHHHEH